MNQTLHSISGFDSKAVLPLPPPPAFAVLNCMDARLDPTRFTSLAHGKAHIIRNPTGRVSDDAIRSLLISHKLLGTSQFFVIHHTHFGKLLSPELDSDLTITEQQQTIVDDVERIRRHPLIPGSIPVFGYLYDVHTGSLIEVAAATRAGAAL